MTPLPDGLRRMRVDNARLIPEPWHRREAKLSQQQLADLLKRTRDEVLATEAGRRRIKAVDLARLGRVVGIRGDILLRRIMSWSGSPD